MSGIEGGLSSEQITAIRVAHELSETIRTSHPEVAEGYRRGLTIDQIIDEYGLGDLTRSREVINTAIHYALQDLIPEDERAVLRHQKQVQNGERNGKKIYEEGRGIFALTLEQLQEIAKENERRGVGIFAQTAEDRAALGRKSAEKHSGIHAQTTEERREEGRKLHRENRGVHGKSTEERKLYAKKALASRGLIPFDGDLIDPETGLNELQYIKALLVNPEFQIKHKGVMSPNRKKIAEKLNHVFHGGQEVRTPNSVSTVLEKLKNTDRK